MHELPRGVVLVEQSFTIENELLTPSGKLCRRKIAAKYEKEINATLDRIDMTKADPLVSLGIKAKTKNKTIKQLINGVLERDEDAPISSGILILFCEYVVREKSVALRAGEPTEHFGKLGKSWK